MNQMKYPVMHRLLVIGVTLWGLSNPCWAAWELAPDPVAEEQSGGEINHDLSLKFPVVRFSSGRSTIASPSPSRFVVLVGGFSATTHEVWDLKKVQKIGEFAGKIGQHRVAALSSDGQCLATLDDHAVQIRTLSDPRILSLPMDSNQLAAVLFVTNDKLLTIDNKHDKFEYKIWEIKTGKSTSIAGAVECEQACVSPGGRWLAVIHKRKNQLLFFDLNRGKLVEVVELGKPNFTFWWDCQGLSFSPNGEELIAAFFNIKEGLLKRWSMKTGEEIGTISLTPSLHVSRENLTMPDSNGLQPFPGGQTYLLFGTYIVDLQAGAIVWSYQHDGQKPSTSAFVVDKDDVMVVAGPINQHELKAVAVPWEKMRANPEDSLLAKDSPIAVTVKVEGAPENLAEVTQKQLTEAIKARIQAAGWKYEEEGNLRIVLEYTEKEGETLKFSEPRFPFGAPRFGTPDSGTGTGFVVTADGHVLTCAHVVGAAKKVAVRLGEKNYSADVKAKDDQLDVALLKIDAKDLAPLLPIKSTTLEVGEEIRAFGFPLANNLGTSLKVTRGAVSGFVQQGKVKAVQTDASINPGNSGGPALNDDGQVIGMCNSKLVGTGVDNVGFIIPSDVVRHWLEDQSIDWVPAAPGERLTGVKLIKKITPSVAFIDANHDRGMAATAKDSGVDLKARIIQATISLRSKDGKTTYWERKLDPEQSVFFSQNRTSESIRESTLNLFQTRIAGVPFPKYVSKTDPTLVLPGRTLFPPLGK